MRLQVEFTFFCNLQSRARTHVVLVIGLYKLLGNPTAWLIEPPRIPIIYEGGILLTCGEHLHDRIISLRGEIFELFRQCGIFCSSFSPLNTCLVWIINTRDSPLIHLLPLTLIEVKDQGRNPIFVVLVIFEIAFTFDLNRIQRSRFNTHCRCFGYFWNRKSFYDQNIKSSKVFELHFLVYNSV